MNNARLYGSFQFIHKQHWVGLLLVSFISHLPSTVHAEYISCGSSYDYHDTVVEAIQCAQKKMEDAVETFNYMGLEASEIGVSLCSNNPSGVVGRYHRHWVDDIALTGTCSWPTGYCASQPPIAESFYDPPESRCVEGCEYQCDGAHGDGSCSSDPDTAFSAEYQPTGEACLEPDHDCEEVEANVFDCRPPVADGDQDCQDEVGNPCNPLTGNKSYSVSDYLADGLEFTRTYHSTQDRELHSYLGRGWSHNYAGYITTWDEGLHLVTSRGRFHPFIAIDSSRYLSTLSDNLVIDETSTAWIVKRRSQHEVYDRGTGLLKAVVHPEQPAMDQFIERDAQGRVAAVRNAKDRSLIFSYENDHLVDVTTPDGSINFQHRATEFGEWELVKVIYPDTQSEQYDYDTRPTQSLLTVVLSADGTPKGLYEYDSRGRAISSRSAFEIEGHTLHYLGSGKTKVVTSLGEEIEYNAVSAQGWIGAATASRLGTHAETIEYADLTFFRPSRIERDGQVSEYAYDSLFRQTLRREGAGTADERVTTTTWNGVHYRKATETQGDSRVVYQYNAQGQLIQETRKDLSTGATRTLNWTYCAGEDPAQGCPLTGLLRQKTRLGGAVTAYDYYLSDAADGTYRRGDLHTLTNAEGHTTEFLEYDPAGRPLRMLDANGVETVLTYHPRGWLESQAVAGATTTYAYRPDGRVERITRPDGSFLQFGYDAAGRLVAIKNGLGERIEYDLDAAGNRLEERILDASGTLRFQLQQVFDQLGRLETSIIGTGHATDYNYDATGNLAVVTDPLGRQTTHDYDPLNRLKKTLDALGGETLFEYDSSHNLTRIADPEGLSTDYVYNGFDELIELDSPDTGMTTYTYDAAGNRETRTDARGVTANYDYDLLNRLTAIDYPDDSLNVAFFYDEDDTVTGCNGSHPVGRLTRIVDASGSTVYCYDTRGNLTRKSQMTGSVTLTLTYQYDAADQVTAISYPSGQTLTFDRNTSEASQVTGMLWNGQPLLYDVSYAPFGPVEGWQFGNGIEVDRVLDPNYRVSALTGRLSMALAYDPSGNITVLGAAEEVTNEQGELEHVMGTRWQEYDYDTLDRLDEVRDGSGNFQSGWTYDAVGNRQSELTSSSKGGSRGQDKPDDPPSTSVREVVYEYAIDSHRLLASGNFQRSYDAAGNTTELGRLTLVHNDANRLAGVRQGAATLATYTHNAHGERVRKDANGERARKNEGGSTTYFIYAPDGRLLGEYNTLGMPVAEYLWLDGLLVGVATGSDLFYIETDHLGTPRVATDPYGDTAWRWILTDNAFGTESAETIRDRGGSGLELNLRFPGQYFDTETGLHYNYFRDYEPQTGRYVQSDPIGLDGGLSTYSYALDSPVRNSDVLGLQALSDFYGNHPRPWGNNPEPTQQCENNCKQWKVKKTFNDWDSVNTANDDIALAKGFGCTTMGFCTAMMTGGAPTVTSAATGATLGSFCLFSTTDSASMIRPGDSLEIEYDVCCVPGKDMPEIRNVKTKHTRGAP